MAGFRGGQIPSIPEDVRQAIDEAVRRRVQARDDMLERALLQSLATGTCGVLVCDDPFSGDVTASVDERVPYATMVYVPARSSLLFDGPLDAPEATPEQLKALLTHLARRLLDNQAG